MKHLRREARSPHTEEHHVGQTAGTDAPGKCLDALQMPRDELDGIQPSEAAGNRLLNVPVGCPYVEAARPERRHKIQTIEL